MSKAKGYEIQMKSRSSDHAPWKAFVWEPLTKTVTVNYNHHDVQPGYTYLYRVRALDNNAEPL